jgi:hypothetical protein
MSLPFKKVSFRGQSLLKRAGVAIEWTPERVEEYIKCSKDPIYFSENYVKIINVDDGIITLKLYDYQKELIETAVDHAHTVAEMSRQAGKTTAVCALVLWYILFNSEKVVGIVANKAETAREILSRIQLAYKYLPDWLQVGVVEFNKGSFLLENNSKVFAGATTSDSLRGYSISLLICDEAAHIENFTEFFTAIFPTISAGKKSKVILISSVFGLNHFWEITENARKGLNDYKLISVPWQRVPGRDEEWKQKTLAGMNFDYERFAQEFENEYLGSSGTLISGAGLKRLSSKIPILEKAGLKMFEKPNTDRTYMCVCDVSEGKGLDYSAFQIIDISEMPYKQVCTFRDNMVSPIDYCEVIFRTATSYNKAGVLIEINNIGIQVAESLYYDFEYDHVLHTQSAGRLGKRISGGFGKAADKGIRTTQIVKSVGCAILKLLVEQQKLVLNDSSTIMELATFSRKNKSYQAEPGKTDDLVMALVLFSWLTEQSYFRELNNINTLAQLREKSDEQIMEELTPFGFIDDGQPEEEITIEHFPTADTWMFPRED